MAKKIYGIDLGTTNSMIGCDNNLISRLVSSKVNLSTSECVPNYTVDEKVVGSYKVDMGIGKEGELSIKASSIVLSNLAKIVKEQTGDTVEDIVVSVPAYFSTNQRQAVREASEMVGLNLVSVINEPTAAAINICSEDGGGILRRGLFAVYDLGGGTFDCTIIDSRSGRYRVVGTDGCILGGDDLDRAIAAKVLSKSGVPLFKRDKSSMSVLIESCREWKINMQQGINDGKSGFGININIPFSMIFKPDSPSTVYLTDKDYKDITVETFGKTVSVLGNLIDNLVPAKSDITVVFVGGSTRCSYLRKYVEHSLSSYNATYEANLYPDFVVGLGVIRYASSLQEHGEDLDFKDVTKQLSIEDSMGKAVVIIPANTVIPCSKTKIVTNSTDTKTLSVRLYQGNSVLAIKNEYIGSLEYEYGSVIPEGMGDVEVTVNVDSDGFITLDVEDLINFGEKRSISLRGF